MTDIHDGLNPIADGATCEHPGIVMRPGPARPGPTGPRVAVVDGPDVWEIIAARHALRDKTPPGTTTSCATNSVPSPASPPPRSMQP